MANEKRLIDANRVINEMRMVLDENPDQKDTVAYHAFSLIIDYLGREPTVDAVEVVHGRWIEGKSLEKCSICGKKGFPDWRYCPNCGAKMDKNENQ